MSSTWSSLSGTGLVPEPTNPVDACRNGVAHARKTLCDTVILDTAGRLQIDDELMNELRQIDRQVKPDEAYLVVDAMIGQEAANVAKAFNDALELNACILTKLDGDARGGAALSIKQVTGKPVKFLGQGEDLDKREEFRPEGLAQRILGMGDVVGLVEQVQRQVDREQMERVATKVKQGRELSLEDFRDQLRQIVNLGGLEELFDKLPGVKPEQLAAAKFDPKVVRRQIGVIDAMTPRERRFPAIIDGSRKRRIAAGAGLPVQDVSRLLKQHKNLTKTMKQVAKAGGMQKLLGAMRSGGPPPSFRGRR